MSDAILQALLTVAAAPAMPPDLSGLGGFDPGTVGKLAAQNRLDALIGSRLVQASSSPGRDDPLSSLLRRAHLVALAENAQHEAYLAEVIHDLVAHDVSVILLKGLAYDRFLYPQAGSRRTGDLDLLIRAHDRRVAIRALLQLGFQPVAASPGFDLPSSHEIEFKRGSVYVDLHTAFAPPGRASFDLETIWSEAVGVHIESVPIRLLAPVHAVLYHALHMALHHFHLPAVHMVDLHRLLGALPEGKELGSLADTWRCKQILAGALRCLSRWGLALPGNNAHRDAFPWQQLQPEQFIGRQTPPTRAMQLLIKFAAFDSFRTLPAFLVDGLHRATWEVWQTRLRGKTAQDRIKRWTEDP